MAEAKAGSWRIGVDLDDSMHFEVQYQTKGQHGGNPEEVGVWSWNLARCVWLQAFRCLALGCWEPSSERRATCNRVVRVLRVA